MARYVDLDTAIENIRNGDGTPTQKIFAECCLLGITTADVAPKIEVAALKIELEAMRTTANAYKMHYEKAKSEVEELSGRYEDLKLKYADLAKDHDELLAWGGHIKNTEKAEIKKAVAREIFEEIEKIINERLRQEITEWRFIVKIAELKKKYTEGE